MGTSHSEGGYASAVTPDQLAQLIRNEGVEDGEDLIFSITPEGETEVFFNNGLYLFDDKEFSALKSLLAGNSFVEYPNDVAVDEIDSTMDFLRDQDILATLAEEAEEDYDGAVSSLVSLLKNPPDRKASSFPSWMPSNDDAYLTSLAKGILLVLGSKPITPGGVVEKLLGS